MEEEADAPVQNGQLGAVEARWVFQQAFKAWGQVGGHWGFELADAAPFANVACCAQIAQRARIAMAQAPAAENHPASATTPAATGVPHGRWIRR